MKAKSAGARVAAQGAPSTTIDTEKGSTDYPIHPAANILPMMAEDELRTFAEDIRANGQLEDIVLLDGKVLDGRNRLAACKLAGVEPRFKRYSASDLNDDEALSYVLSANLHRRHLSESQRAMVAARLCKNSDRGSRPAGKALNVSHATVCEAVKLLDHGDEELIARVSTGQATLNEARKAIKGAKREERRAELRAVRAPESERWSVHCSPVAEASKYVAPGSIDIIVTDPPYPKEYIGTFTDLAAFAAHALKPGGSLVVMTGGCFLPEYLDALRSVPELEYRWTCSYRVRGAKPQVFPRGVMTAAWKPVLWFVKLGAKCETNIACDEFDAPPDDGDKSEHHWGQSVGGMELILSRFGGDIVCDPFCGGGSTGVAALRLGRKFIGLDIDRESVEVTRGRLASVVVQ